MTQTANYESKALNLPKHLPPLCRRQNCEHHLRDIERVSPVVVSNVSIVLLDTQQPPTKHLVVNVELFYKVEVEEHPETSFEGAVVIQAEIVKSKIMQFEISCRWNFQVLMEKFYIFSLFFPSPWTIDLTINRIASSVDADA